MARFIRRGRQLSFSLVVFFSLWLALPGLALAVSFLGYPVPNAGSGP